MATADELLAALTNSDEDDKVLVIDNDLRTISIPKSIKALGVESDDEVHRLYFQMPRMCGDVDLSTFNIRVNYMNANREGDIYVVTDKKILSNSITFSWLVGRNALAYKGDVNFIVCLKESNASGDVLREFNTTVASLPVLEGLEVDPAYLEGELHDVLEQLLSLTVAKVAEVEAAGSEQVAKVQQESTKQQENITEHGAQVLATIPADYQTTAKLADEGVRSKADAIIRTSEGKHIEVNDASDDNLRGLKLFGKTTQFTTNGAQLSYVHIQNADFSYLGVTASATADGNILLNGTTTEAIWNRLASAELIAGKTYTMTSDPSLILTVWDIVAGSALTTKHSGEKSITFTAPNTGRYAITLANGAGATFSNTLADIMCNEGKLSLSWEPYTGSIPSPNPDYPQPLVSPGNGGNINTTVAGKNLFGGDALADKLVEVASSTKDISAGTVTISGTNVTYNPMLFDGAFKENTQYTIVLYGRNNAETGDATNMSIFYTDGTNEDIRFPKVSGDRYVVHTTMTGKTVSHLYCRYQSGISILYYDKCGIFEGVLTEADFEPYVGSNLTASTPNGLPGIPVESGGNHVDENGQQWICDEVDFERGVYMQRIAAKTLDGSISYQEAGTQVGGTYTVFTVFSDIWIKETDRFISDIFRCYSSEKYRTGDAEGIYSNPGDANCNLVIVRVNNSRATDMDTFKQWITEHPCVVYCPLKTPIETPLSADDLASFKAAKTAKPYTQIFNDSDVEMEASYNADTEIYIDNKIAERVPRNSYVAPAIVETKSGEVISLSDSSDDTVRGLKLFGKTKQFTTTGKNLLPYPYADGTSKTHNGITYTVNADGSVTANGTATADSYFNVHLNKFPFQLKKGERYVWSGCPKGGSNTTYRLRIQDTTYTQTDSDLGNGFELTAEYENYYAWIDVRAGITVNNLTFYPMIRLASVTDDTYEPYTGGIAAPNPDYPQPLESVGAGGDVRVTVAGKNLIGDNRGLIARTDKGVTYTPVFNADGTLDYILVNGTATGKSDYWCHTIQNYGLTLPKGKTVTLSGGTETISLLLQSSKAIDGQILKSTPSPATAELQYDTYGCWIRVASGTTVTNVKVRPQLEFGSVATAYEPYKPIQTLTASTPNGLHGIDSVKDEIDFARGVRVQRLGTVVFDGSADEPWNYANSYIDYPNSSTLYARIWTPLSAIGVASDSFALCDKLSNYGVGLNYAPKHGAELWTNNANFHVLPGKDYLYSENSINTMRQWLSDNPITVLYELATPIETPLTRAELEAYRAAALHTNYPSTTIFNDTNAGQEVTYVADTKNWIKNQLAL